MHSVVAVIPIKSVSKRVPGKNFRSFCGHPLYKFIISNAVNAQCFDRIYVDTDHDDIKEYAQALNLEVIDRDPILALDSANGNDLLCHHADIVDDADCFFQLFATAPLLTPKTIQSCVDALKNHPEKDSILTVTEEYGWYWFSDMPVNYRPSILPRSQDARPVIKETTGLYGIRKESLMKHRSRIGANPMFHVVEQIQALDIDTEEDFLHAESVAQKLLLNKTVIRVV